MRRYLPVLLLTLVSFSLPARAIDVFVDDIGSCSNAATCGRGANPPCCKIQNAICNAAAGDNIKVQPGTYFESIRMKANVSVISTNGPAVTTINGTGKKCATTNWCGVQTNDCSVVLINDYVAAPTTLSGFTITGGKGVHITSGGGKDVGGGIYCSGEPIISNNIITGNNVTGTSTRWAGGGMYFTGVVTPPVRAVVSNNTITGNTVKPPAGSPAYTYGLGGGVYTSFFSAPTFTNNIVSNNEAGNRAAVATWGNGGGFFIVNKAAYPTVISGNIISGNLSRDQGGGIAVEAYSSFGPHSRAIISNNEIRGNDVGFTSTYGEGGGVSLYYAQVTLANNTIHSNTAAFGGGLNELPRDPTDLITSANNIFTSNVSRLGAPVGGAIQSSAPSCHVVKNNDFWQNGTAQIGGACAPSLIGTAGNVQVNPLYVNPGANNFHLDPSSLLIDVGSNLEAPTTDRDGFPRPLDGNFDGTSIADLGQYELATDCEGDGTKDYVDLDDDNDGDPDTADCDDCNPNRYHGRPEACNSIDDDCDASVDEGFPDSDVDGQSDCVDPDDDNDLVLDGADCAPLVNSVWSTPGVVGSGVRVAKPGNVTWTHQIQSNIANVYKGTLQTGGWTYNHSCFETESPDDASSDLANPPTGKALYYLIQAKNRCGSGTLGTNSAGGTRPTNTPCGTLSQNSDGDSIVNIDDNCPLIANANQLDNDHDTIGDVCDADRDNDGVLNTTDCAPDDVGSFAAPAIVNGVKVTGKSPTTVSWTAAPIGSAAKYDIATGLLASARVNSFTAGSCLASDETVLSFVDLRSNPAPGAGYYYMVRSQNACGTGSYGTPARDLHGSVGGGACP